jgi:hypothetical protein
MVKRTLRKREVLEENKILIEGNMLIDEIVDLCYILKIVKNEANEKEIRDTIEMLLEEAGFIDDLYNSILKQAIQFKISDTKKVKDILSELIRVKLQLEDKKKICENVII